MTNDTATVSPKPLTDTPGRPAYRFISVLMLLVGCGCVVLSGVVKEINQDKLAFVTGAAVFIPMGIAGCAMAYTAAVKAALLQRIEELERRLQNGGG